MTIKWQFYYSAHASCTQCALNSSDQQVLVYVCLKNYTKCNLSTSLVTVHCSVFDYSQTTVYCKYLPFIYQFISLNLVLYLAFPIYLADTLLCAISGICAIFCIFCAFVTCISLLCLIFIRTLAFCSAYTHTHTHTHHLCLKMLT